MKALIVSKAFVVATYRQKLTELGRCGVEVVALAPPLWREAGGIQTLEPATKEGYELRVTEMRWNGHFHVHYYPELPSILDEVRPDVVHVDEEPYNLATYLGVRAAARRGIPSLFFTWQNLLKRYPPPFRQLETRVYRTVAYALAGSEEASRVLRARGYTGPLTVVPQFGVDPELFKPGEPHDSPFTVGFLNRFIPAKEPLLALEAFTALPSDARMVMVGDGPLLPDVSREVRQRRLESRVTVQARVPSMDVPAILRSLDVALLPSRSLPGWKEQFGRVLIEAMASGVPVIATDSGEIPRVVRDAGILVPQSDRDALAAALLALYHDRELRVHLGRKGRHRVLEEFTHTRIAEITARAYRAALA